jgi:hypothetical protein
VLVILGVADARINSFVEARRLWKRQPLILVAIFLYEKGRLVATDVAEMKLDVPPPDQ